MAKEKSSRGQYGELVARLQELVGQLEGGELSLEDSLERFAEGVRLVKQGEKLLSDAERRVEQLLSEDGATAPLDPATKEPPAKRSARKSADDEGDVPF